MNTALRTFVIGGVLGAGVVSGGALAFAQTTGTTAPPASEVTPGTAPADGSAPAPGSDGCDGIGRHGLGHEGAEELAAELGVTADQVREARQAAHDAVHDQLGELDRPDSRPLSDEEREQLTADRRARAELHTETMAGKLGVTPERLREASIAALAKRLDAAVAEDRMTREEADERLAEARDGDLELGDLRGLRGGGRHGRGR